MKVLFDTMYSKSRYNEAAYEFVDSLDEIDDDIRDQIEDYLADINKEQIDNLKTLLKEFLRYASIVLYNPSNSIVISTYKELDTFFVDNYYLRYTHDRYDMLTIYDDDDLGSMKCEYKVMITCGKPATYSARSEMSSNEALLSFCTPIAICRY